MNEEIFDKISDLLAKSGTPISKKMDGGITVMLPDSDEKLAECMDNDDGTLSYTLYLGNGSTENGNGTPEEFKEHVVNAMDSWIECVPYDQFMNEPSVSTEYDRAVAESRETVMRNTLFEMGLDSIQTEAIMEVADALMESSEVSAFLGGKELFGSSVNNLATRKENKNYIKRQWAMEQYKERGKQWPGKTVLTDDALAAIGMQPPTDAQLVDYVKSHMSNVDEHRFVKGDDEQYSGAVYTKFDSAPNSKISNNGKGKAKTDDGSSAVMSSEGSFEIEDDNNYDADVDAQKIRRSDNEAEKTYSSGEEASEQLGSQVSEVDSESAASTNEVQERMIKTLNEMGYINDNIRNLQNFQLEQCIFAVSKLNEKNRFDPEKYKNASPEVLLKAVGYKGGAVPSQQEIAEAMMPSLWVGNASSLDSSTLDEFGEDAIPVQLMETIEDAANNLKASLFNDAHEVFEKVPVGTPMKTFIEKLPKGTPTRFLMEALYGNQQKGNTGIVNQILTGDQQLMAKIENGDKIIDGSAFTPVQNQHLSAALNNPVMSATIRLIQDSFGVYIDSIVEQLPVAYGESAQNGEDAGGTYAGIPQSFVNMVRSIMLGKGYPLADYSWKAIDTLINNFGSVMAVSAPAASRKVSGTIARKPAIAH